jgi:hypothetical protein
MNPKTGRYEKEPSKVNFMKLPYELKVEETQDQRIKAQGAQNIITGRFVNKKREFFSGLRGTAFKHWYHGNDYEFVRGEKVNSLVLFRFSEQDEFLTVYYFNRYYKQSIEQRLELVNSFIGRAEY